MSEDELDAAVLHRVGMDRRAFVRRMLLGGAFAIPVIASFDMSTLTVASAWAMTPNGGTHHTKLVATAAYVQVAGTGSATLEFFDLSATLTSSGVGVCGETITFSAGGHKLGTATTDGGGTATLSVSTNLGTVLKIIRAGGYSAHFAGAGWYGPSSGKAALIEIG